MMETKQENPVQKAGAVDADEMSFEQFFVYSARINEMADV